MKINYSISLKLTLIVVLLSTGVVISLAYFNIGGAAERLDSSSDKASDDFAESHSIIKALEEKIVKYFDLNDTEKLQKEVSNFSIFIQNRSKVIKVMKININTPGPNGLKINISSDKNLIGGASYPRNEKAYKNGSTFYTVDTRGDNILTVISPVNISGEIVGTYEMVLLINLGNIPIDPLIKNIVLSSFVCILVLVFSLLYLLRKAIVKPIIAFRDVARVIGTGDLNAKINIDSRDELGELASAFNEMTNDLKKSREKIERYNKTLEKVLKQKDEFIHQLGHDLKNPLTPLVGLLPMIIEREEDPKNKEQLCIIHQNVEFMRDLIFETLELARLRSDNVKFNFEPLNLFEEVEKIIGTQKLFLDEHKTIAKNKVEKGIMVTADKLRLVEIFNNLISNAVKYTLEEGGTITIAAEEAKTSVKISVKDTGIGMTKEQTSLIFDEFYKADKAFHDLHSSGLGLSICKRIVEKHGGRIWVESPGPGKGSTFYFTLKKSI